MSSRRSWTLAGTILVIGLGMLVPASSSAVEIQAHRGGSNVDGKAAFLENSMAGFSHSLDEGFTIEFDLQPTSDGVAVVMHDEELDRTTNCSGEVDDKTLAQLGSCRIDQLGSDDPARILPPGDSRLEPIPTLAKVIDLLEKTGGQANIEAKDLLGRHPEFSGNVYRQLEASDVRSSRVTVHNFKPGDLERAHELYPGVTTSFLTITPVNPFAIQTAVEEEIDQVSPQWPISAGFAAEARAASLTIAPFTLDEASDIKAAAALGVDSLITNDPTFADRLVGPRPALSLKVLKGKSRARPGKVLVLTARVNNSGDGQSDPVRLGIRFSRKSLKPAGPVSQVVPVIKPGAGDPVRFRVRVRRGAKKFGRFPVTFRLSGTGKPAIKKVRKVRVLRPGN